ncbi:MAG: amino acid adenylation domain-containing protein, partial [Neisseriaceae bacterium]
MKNQVAILGNFELVIECCNLIKASEFNIKCIFSETPSVVEWAEVHNIPVATKLDCFFQIIKSEEIDYLFSIQNPYIIPNEIIEHVGLAINYHNTLLPKYGGTRNNMCWVIWFNENQNGITWHVINDVIDGGGILKQIKFDIDKEETAFSLELKCQDFAKQGLRELLSDLKSDKLIVKLQDLKKRSFYYSYSRPCGFAVIDCNFPAEKIWKQFRALNFGSQPNPIATLKFKYKRKYFFIKEIHLLESKTDEFNPGTVIDINDNVILVTTLTSDMSINCYSDLSSIIKAKDVVEREQSLPKDQIKIAELIAKDEEYWKKVLLSFVPMKNFSQNRNINKYTNYQTITEFKFSEICNNSIKCKVNFETILTTLIGYLFKLNNFEQISLCLKGDKIVKVPDQTFTDLFLDIKPLNLVLDQYTTFNYALEKIKDLYSILVQKNVINKDVLVRYPKCMDTFSLNTLLVSISSNFDYKNYESNYPIIINVNESLQLVSLFIANKFIDSMPLFLNFIQEHFKILFESWVIDHKKLEEIHLLSQVEIQYWNDWNPIVENFSKKISVPDLLDKVCLSFPDNVAIESKNYKITYKELKSYSELMAKNLLRHLGNQSNSSNLIGVFLDKSPYTIITFLAILKSGTGYVVLDTSYPDTYLENIFLSSEPQLIIYENNVDRLNKISVNINKNVKPILLNLNDLLQINEAYIQLPTISDHNIAYVLFTSGSTGKPKGVAISHGSLINLCYATISHIGINKDDKMLQFAKLAFDASVFEIYSILIAGGILYVPDANEAVIGFDLKDTIVNNKISTLFLTPSSAVVQPYFKSSSLKRIIFGGEICSQMLVNKWGKGYEIFNGYGPTECTVFTTMTGSLKEYTSLIIGKPLRNYQVMVCDSHQKLLPLGAVGELVVSGIGIAKGYINGSKLTTERFKYIHFQGKNIYSYITGDLARWTIGGEIEYLGRNDLQVKVRGHRIETNLIEKTITAFNGINSCMVLADHDPNGVISLNAYILLQNVNSDFDIGLLKRFIDKKLPQFMLPSKFFLINHIPLTASGKIDTQTLLSQYNIPLLDKV